MRPTLLILALFTFFTHANSHAAEWIDSWRATNHVWRGVHLWADDDEDAKALIVALPKLAAAGANSVVLEINYSYAFESHPELRKRKVIAKERAREITAAARACGIRLIPEFNCMGHQSFSRRREPLLATFPEFNETPSKFATNKEVYCLSWCPRAPGLQKIVTDLIDDIADGFRADAIHVGMDEVYLIGAEDCPLCKGVDPAKLFAQQVNDLHEHIVKKRKFEMLIWSDRVVGVKHQGTSQYDTKQNDLSGCVDLIPKDIIQCDWQYVKRTNYTSLTFLLGKGFRVWPSGFQPLETSRAFSDFARSQNNERVLGYLCTTWNVPEISTSAEWPPIKDILPAWKQ